MSERLPSQRCPFCGIESKPLLWSLDTINDLQRGYRCPNCSRTWSVDGRQESMFNTTDPDEAPALRLEDLDGNGRPIHP
jgi:hypothetical protein